MQQVLRKTQCYFLEAIKKKLPYRLSDLTLLTKLILLPYLQTVLPAMVSKVRPKNSFFLSKVFDIGGCEKC